MGTYDWRQKYQTLNLVGPSSVFGPAPIDRPLGHGKRESKMGTYWQRGEVILLEVN